MSNKSLIALLIGFIAVLGGALAAFLIIRKKFAADDDFDEFEDFILSGYAHRRPPVNNIYSYW